MDYRKEYEEFWKDIVEDENGNRFELIGPESIRFSEGIPEWYMKCWAFMIKGITDKSQIGDYVKLVKE